MNAPPALELPFNAIIKQLALCAHSAFLTMLCTPTAIRCSFPLTLPPPSHHAHASQPTYLRVSTGLERQQQLMATDNIREGLDSLGGLGPRALTLTQRFSLGELSPIAPKLYSYCVAHPFRWTKKKIKKKINNV